MTLGVYFTNWFAAEFTWIDKVSLRSPMRRIQTMQLNTRKALPFTRERSLPSIAI
jgi:hypothetical protein